MTKKKMFTLIEMLIVIVIIGILAAALVPRLVAVQGRARDTKRKVDISQLESSIKLYQVDNGMYPSASGGTWSNSYETSQWITGLMTYMSSLPGDPLGVSIFRPATGAYSYAYYRYEGPIAAMQYKAYVLISRLESRTDPDRCEVKQYTYRITSNDRYCATGCNVTDAYDCGQLFLKSDMGR